MLADKRPSVYPVQPIEEKPEHVKRESDVTAKEVVEKPKPWLRISDIQQSYIYAKPAEPILQQVTTSAPRSPPTSPIIGNTTPMGMTIGYSEPSAARTTASNAAKAEPAKTPWSPRPFNIRSPSMVSLANSLSTYVDTSSIRSGSTTRTAANSDYYGWETSKPSIDSQRTARSSDSRTSWAPPKPVPSPQPSKPKRSLLFRVLNK